LGDFEKARASAQQAHRLEPLSPVTNYIAAVIHVLTGSFREAEVYARRALELDPSFPMGHLSLGWIHQHFGRHDDAISTLRRFVQLSDRTSWSLGSLGQALLDAGRLEEAEAILRELETDPDNEWFVGQLYWKLGQQDQAFELIENAARKRQPLFYLLARAPGLDRMTKDARWGSILRQCGLHEIARGFEASR
jgi:tetratricopeptide (TPR) repeat protein